MNKLFMLSFIRQRGIAALFILGALLMIGTQASAASAQPQASNLIFYACINNQTGSVTIIPATHTCPSTARKVQWNQTGPVGPQGATGATGPVGPQGPAGMTQDYFALNNNGAVTIPGVAVSNGAGSLIVATS